VDIVQDLKTTVVLAQRPLGEMPVVMSLWMPKWPVILPAPS
jgi:hypothetical protein